MAAFRILSIDGGGIKGIFPAAFLAEIEKKTGKRIVDHFDLIVGTSTGGVIALGLSLGMPAKKILDVYKRKGADIFPRKRWRNFLHIFRTKYSPVKLRLELERIFGTHSLDDAQTRVVIPAMGDTGEVYIFKTPHHKKLINDHRESMVDVAMATSSAPSYFPVHKTPRGIQALDGGLWANNPAMVGVVEALSLLGKNPKNIKLLSLGCSASVSLKSWEKTGGLAAWTLGSVGWLLHGQSVSAMNQARLLVGSQNVFRIQPKVASGLFSVDDLQTALAMEGGARQAARSNLTDITSNFFSEPKGPYTPLCSDT